MIITITKPLQEIIANLQNYNRLFIVGCAACATKCQTGSEDAVNKMAAELEQAGKQITGSTVLDTPCDIRIAKKDLKKFQNDPSVEAFLILACGAGVQAVGKTVPQPVLPALNPLFTGTTERIGIYHEYCALCGDCMLDKTGGICPITRCAKSLINGPCGGTFNGKCEVDAENDCAWVLILEKLKEAKKSGGMLSYIPPRTNAKPRKLNKTK